MTERKQKWILVRRDDYCVSALWKDFKIEDLNVCETDSGDVGKIYVGHVRNIVKNIQAAFVEYKKDCFGYLELKNCPPNLVIHEGDDLLVQVQRDAVKTKNPVLSMNLQIAGRYCIAMKDSCGVCISAKIRNEEWKRTVKELFDHSANVIVRTNSYELQDLGLLQTEYCKLCAKLEEIEQIGTKRTPFSLIYTPPMEYCTCVRDSKLTDFDEILTDDEEIYRELYHTLEPFGTDVTNLVKLIQPIQGDYLSLEGKFGIFKEMDRLTQRVVHLPSGAYLVIDYTEALTVIDVNSGKAVNGKKNKGDEAFLKLNCEAAVEVARQIRLRNLSGMILVDFIDMKAPESTAKLVNLMKAEVYKDPVPVSVVDITGLGIMELTRKRVTKPLHERIRNKDFQISEKNVDKY